MTATIRLATPNDAHQIAAIYAPFCTDTIVSFEVDAPSPETMAERIGSITERFPWLILDDDGTVAGYVYASKHRERAAYQWAVDVTAYIAAPYRRKGVGRALYTALLRVLVVQGFYKAYAGIALPNDASVGLHTALGFEPVGVYCGVGYKFNVWHDVAWYGLAVQPEQPAPAPPRGVHEIIPSLEWQVALEAGMALYR